MGLIQRKKQISGDDNDMSNGTSTSSSVGGRGGKGGNRILYVLKKVIIAVIVAGGLYLILDKGSVMGDHGSVTCAGSSIKIDFKRGDDGLPTLGPHSIIVDTEWECRCSDTNGNAPWARVSVDALIHIPLTPTGNQGGRFYKGDFTVPMAGNYKVEIHWVESCPCIGTSTSTSTSTRSGGENTTESENYCLISERFIATGSTKSISITDAHVVKKDTVGMFTDNAAWIEYSKVKVPENKMLGDYYVWADTSKVVQGTDMKRIEYDYGEKRRTILQDAIVTDTNGFYNFKALSNYELVCWLGSDSAKNTRDAFLSLRPKLFSGQRPFKFHYYESYSLVNPDATWSDETKKKFRKCKHVIVSMDEPTELLSRSEYKIQMTRFLQHLTTAINDETFPIWVLTNMESPLKTKNCLEPKSTNRPSSVDHPCNEVLREIPVFARADDSDTSFHGMNRVRLLDNTDLSLPHFNISGEQMVDIYAAVAMRIFIIVGRGVKEWRDKGQIGHINGLTRGNVEEPNFDLVPYDWSSDLATNVK